jgi:lactoylglutathione lyase
MDLRVELFVDDLDASIRFYEGALGFRLARREADYDAALQAVVSAGHQVVEPPRDQSWGLRDFRVADPDGYYWRITHP